MDKKYYGLLEEGKEMTVDYQTYMVVHCMTVFVVGVVAGVLVGYGFKRW